MKKILLFLLLGITLIGVTGCDKEENNIQKEEYNKELVSCLENQLGAHILSEQDDLEEIPLSDIKDSDESISYYKGYRASQNSDNLYVLIVWKDKIYSFDEIKEVEEYFYSKYDEYQEYSISSEGISIYIHNDFNDIDFEELKKACISDKKDATQVFPEDISDEISNTDKIIVKYDGYELGTITSIDVIDEILDVVVNSKRYGNDFLADNYIYKLELYSDDDLVDTIGLWADGKRVSSLNNNTDYYVTDEDLRKVIEYGIDYKFYNIVEFSDNCEDETYLIYSDNSYNYYLNCANSDGVLITFVTCNKKMNIEYAMDNNYIDIKVLARDYPDLITRERK